MSLDRPLFLKVILSYLLQFFGLVFGEYYSTSVQSIADVFAIRQEKCRVHGQKGWAYFSRKEAVYERTSPTDKEIYLWAFSRGNNNYVGNIIGGEKIPALIVEKKK